MAKTDKGVITFYVLFGILAAVILGLVIYGFISGSLENGTNFYFFGNNGVSSKTGSQIAGSINILLFVFCMGIGIFYYNRQKVVYRDRFKNYFSGHEEEEEYKEMMKQINFKISNVSLIFATIAFFFLFLGVSTFMNEENYYSIYQAYRRECPQNTISAEDTKHPSKLV